MRTDRCRCAIRWIAVFCIMAVAGCGDTDCFVVAKDAKGIRKDSPVLWQDAYVGSVSAVEPLSDGAKVSLGLKRDFAKNIHAGVAARIVLDDKVSDRPFVLLVGGKDPSMPVLADGAQIPEAVSVASSAGGGVFLGWLKESSHAGEKAGGGIIVLLLFVMRFVKKLIKTLIKLMILIVLLLTMLVVRQDWSAYQERFASAASGFQSVQAWISEHSETLKNLVEQAVPADRR